MISEIASRKVKISPPLGLKKGKEGNVVDQVDL
jgi:hypothetical protein